MVCIQRSLMYINMEEKMRNTSEYNVVQYNTTFNYDLGNKHITELTHLHRLSTKTEHYKLPESIIH